MTEHLEIYLRPTDYIDSENTAIREFARQAIGENADTKERAVRLFFAVRDQIRYNPYLISPDKTTLVASNILARREGYCVQKAILLAALARASRVPCRLGFAIVKNHLTTKRLRELLQSDLFVFHGYNELFINGRWMKATPTFDINLCERFGVVPLDFDGEHDAIFHPYDRAGQKHMEYIHDYGTFDDLPYDLMISEVVKHYPHLAEAFTGGAFSPQGNFMKEAAEEKL